MFAKQGYATIEGKVLEIEVWGLGGAEIRENQAKLQERKNLFVEQKRKVLFSIGYYCYKKNGSFTLRHDLCVTLTG